MPTDVIMPQMGESIFEGTITKWLKKAGDAVEKDEPLFEISTDKVDAEIPSPVAGVLSEVRFPEGATVEVNTVVAVLAERNGATSGAGDVSTATAAAARETVKATESGAGAVDVVMPQMGESIFEGTITKWLKKAGDAVKKDEPLFEISTDKVDAEIPSPMDGVLTEIRHGEGDTVEVNTVVAVLASAVGAAGASSTKPETANAALSGAKPAALRDDKRVDDRKVIVAPQAQSAPPKVVRSSPLVRKIAEGAWCGSCADCGNGFRSAHHKGRYSGVSCEAGDEGGGRSGAEARGGGDAR